MRIRPWTVSRLIVPLFLGFVVLVVAAERASWLVAGDAADVPPVAPMTKPHVRREGTQLRDEPGRFITAGSRITFISSDSTNYLGLENLNLERVAKIITASPDSVEWFVTGTVTEYQGSNYLLISRARRKPSAPKVPRGF